MAYVNLGQIIYPVGSFYSSTDSTSPANLFGGTWEQLKDLDPLLATTDNNNVGKYVGYRCMPVSALPPHWHPVATEQSQYPGVDLDRFVKLFVQGTVTSNTGTNGWLLASDDPRSFDEIQTSIKEALYANTFINGNTNAKNDQIPLQPEGYGCYMWHRIA